MLLPSLILTFSKLGISVMLSNVESWQTAFSDTINGVLVLSNHCFLVLSFFRVGKCPCYNDHQFVFNGKLNLQVLTEV